MKNLKLSLFLTCFAIGQTTAFAKDISESDIRAHIEILASDDFEGREPGTAGETKTIGYISKSWANSGLKPAAADGTWFDAVPLQERKSVGYDLILKSKSKMMDLNKEQYIFIGNQENINLSNANMIFVGFGVNKQGDVAADVKGKIVYMLMDNAPFDPMKNASLADRRTALRQAGAAAIIYVVEPQERWQSIKSFISSPRKEAQSDEDFSLITGGVSAEFMVALVTNEGGDWDDYRNNAKDGAFQGHDLTSKADLNVATSIRKFNSYNVFGKIAGKKKDAGSVLILGHWDHLGICRPDSDEDKICNGAVDNASGIAVINEVAKKLGKRKYDRDIYFLATTGEESGLLGAYNFVKRQPIKLEDIVISLNIDTIAIAKKNSKVAIIGRGTTDLDSHIEKVALKLGRDIDSTTEANAFIRRQDGWAFTQENVPAVMAGGSFADLNLLQEFLGSHYHGPDDELTEDTELGGATEDANLHVELVKYFASKKKYMRKKGGESMSDDVREAK
ncbi:hypothetical protein LPB140_08475 [Sphingorhabdus lutea]|uniref:Peptidase M28 domain-containing protein n=1 Tax=Sphingorhabdus lutea TaxID=1913578 RepID=A0A1L3JCE4_9SPHN|nr:M28 family peptidase [Sphingorhabdus lutea]APG62817.1 hypothetical protein LPB140_08475 [Sphingorhabdus lutea]